MLQRLLASTPCAPVPCSTPFLRPCPGRQSLPSPPSSTATAFSRYEAVQVISVRSPSGDSEDFPLQTRRAAWTSASTSSNNDGSPKDVSGVSLGEAQKEQPRLVRIRLSVEYRVHSRQLLCIGGSQIPFGWSFLSIARVPMVWTDGDIWTTEVDLPVNSRIEYKYVILEEQDWTKQESEDAEGVVTFTYRTQPDSPPDVQTIQKQMAIVAWQPGPNKVVQVPSEDEVRSLKPGEVRERTPARPPARSLSPRRFAPTPGFAPRSGGREAPSSTGSKGPNAGPVVPEDDEMVGTWERLLQDETGEPLLERRDVWGFAEDDAHAPRNRGLRYG